MTGWRNRDEIPRDPWISEIAKRARVAESEIYALRERRGDDLGSRKRPLSVGGVDLDESSDTLELGFQVVTGFRGPRVDVHRMLEKGDPESVKNFLDWCRDMAHLALQAARDPSIARKTEASAEDALQRRDEAASTVVSEQEGQSAAAGGGGGTK